MQTGSWCSTLSTTIVHVRRLSAPDHTIEPTGTRPVTDEQESVDERRLSHSCHIRAHDESAGVRLDDHTLQANRRGSRSGTEQPQRLRPGTADPACQLITSSSPRRAAYDRSLWDKLPL